MSPIGQPVIRDGRFPRLPCDQPHRREIDFNQLAEQTYWSDRWSGYELYREVLENARNARTRIVGTFSRAGRLSRP
jgi:hypothetical protein